MNNDRDLERFRTCADAYGAHRRRWPEAYHALHDRLAATPDGVAILAAAERTDAFLDAWTTGAAGPAVADRIVDAAAGGPRFGRRRMAWSAAAFAASALAGFAIGFAQVPDEPSADFVSQVLVGPTGPQGIGL